MLVINSQQKWMDLPDGNGVKLLLSPLPARKRTLLVEQFSKTEGKGREARLRFDQDGYQLAVAEHCVHGWQGVVSKRDGQLVDEPFSPAALAAVMQIDVVAAFVLTTVCGLAIHLAKAEADAGNA